MAIRNDAPDGAKILDLEAARVARAEVRAAEGQGNPFLKLTAGYVEVRPEIAVSVAATLQNGEIREALQSLLVDPADVDVLLEDGLSIQDLEAITKFLTGLTLGE
jgi:hypothetical protein